MNGDQSTSTIAWIVGIALAPILSVMGWIWTVASGARCSAADAHEKIARLDERGRETREAIGRVEAAQEKGFDNVLARMDAVADSLGNRMDASHDAMTKRIDGLTNGRRPEVGSRG